MERSLDFEDFFAASWPRLYRTAFAVAGDAASAEDALQGAYARAYASWARVQATEHPESYVRRMVVNEILGTRRRGWWRRERPQAEPELHASVTAADVAVLDRDAVWEAIRSLPPRQRAVIVLRYYEDLSEREIAEVLGCSTGTVKSQASRALASLRATSRAALEGEIR